MEKGGFEPGNDRQGRRPHVARRAEPTVGRVSPGPPLTSMAGRSTGRREKLWGRGEGQTRAAACCRTRRLRHDLGQRSSSPLPFPSAAFCFCFVG